MIAYVICTIHGLEKGLIVHVFVHIRSKNGPYILHTLHKNFTYWMQFKFFILSGYVLLREGPFHIVNCLKLFDFTLFFVYTLKLLKGPRWHISLLYFEKHMTCSGACGSRVVHQLSTFKQNNAKTKCESLRGAPPYLWKKGARGPKRQPCSPSLISIPALNYIQKKEQASLYNTRS